MPPFNREILDKIMENNPSQNSDISENSIRPISSDAFSQILPQTSISNAAAAAALSNYTRMLTITSMW